MKTYARIEDGQVAELFQTDGDISQMFHPSLVWMDVTNSNPQPQPGWEYANGAFIQPVENLTQAQAAQSDLVNAACAAQIMGGVQSSALGSAHTYPTKASDQANLSASILDTLLPDNAGNASYTTPFWCCDASGTWAWVMHTAAQIQQVGRDVKASILAAQGKNARLQAQITAATTVAAVHAITW